MLTEVLSYRVFHRFVSGQVCENQQLLTAFEHRSLPATVAQSAYGNPTRATELGLKSADGEWEVIWETVFSVLSGSEV